MTTNFVRSLFATKSLETILKDSDGGGEAALKRVLGPITLLALGVGAIVGAGIFVLTGAAAAQYAGPAVVLSFILAATVCAFVGLCYSEFASLIPIAGSAYTYGYATLGEGVAWIVGWNLILVYLFGAATVALGWSGYAVSLLQDFGIKLPPQWSATPGTELVLYHNRWEAIGKIQPMLDAAHVSAASLPHVHAACNLVAVLIILLITAILVVGIQESARFNSMIVIVKISIVLIFVVIAASFLVKHPAIAAANWHPFIPPNAGEYGKYGISGIARGAAVVFFAYLGFDTLSTLAQEVKRPQRDMPICILGSLVICTILYVTVAGLLTAMVSYKILNVADPVAVGIDAAGIRWGSFLVKLGAIAGLGSVILVMLLGQSRIIFTMSRDRLLPKWPGSIHPRFRTPYISSLVVGVLVSVIASLLPIGVLGEIVSIGTLLAFVVVCAGVWVLRVTRPDLHRPFKAPGVPFVPIIGMLVSVYLMISLPRVTWICLVSWLILGLFIYFGYSRRHSLVQKSKTEVKHLAIAD
jgi:APA family basic amino acid/polyamine antiporter